MWETQEKLREESLILHVWQFVTHSATHSVTQNRFYIRITTAFSSSGLEPSHFELTC